MPIKKTSKGTYKFGESGKEYGTRAGAVDQMKAMYAAGYQSKDNPNEKKTKKKSPKGKSKK
jgi:hypothetical protein